MPGAWGDTAAGSGGLAALNCTTQAFGLTCWLQAFRALTSFDLYQQRKTEASNLEDVMVAFSGGKVQFAVANAAGQDSYTGARLILTDRAYRWKHLGLSWDGARLLIAVDGAAVESLSTTGARTPTAGGTRQTVMANGILQDTLRAHLFDVRVFPGYAPTSRELAACMDPRRIIIPANGTIWARWFINGAVPYDESGNGNNWTTCAGGNCEEPPWRRTLW